MGNRGPLRTTSKRGLSLHSSMEPTSSTAASPTHANTHHTPVITPANSKNRIEMHRGHCKHTRRNLNPETPQSSWLQPQLLRRGGNELSPRRLRLSACRWFWGSETMKISIVTGMHGGVKSGSSWLAEGCRSSRACGAGDVGSRLCLGIDDSVPFDGGWLRIAACVSKG